jgi:DNA-binding HxlR family transcriptional regulator
LTGSGLSESRSGFRARAGTLTLLFLASEEDRELLVAMLAHLEAALLDPLTDPDDWDFTPEEEDEEDADEEDDSELLYVSRVLREWLRKSPTGPLRLREEESSMALAALVSGWGSTVVHALSGAALTLEELESATGAVRPEVLAARVEAMEDVGLLEPLEGAGGETRYAATRWLRQAIGPLAAAARLERRQEDEDAAPPDVLDVGAAFLLTLPLLELPTDLGGCCRLGVQMPSEDLAMAGATAQVENGHVVFADPALHPEPETWATGSPIGWLDTLVEPGEHEVAFGGEDQRLPESLVAGLHEELFGEIR